MTKTTPTTSVKNTNVPKKKPNETQTQKQKITSINNNQTRLSTDNSKQYANLTTNAPDPSQMSEIAGITNTTATNRAA